LESNPKPGQLEITGTKGSYIFDGRTYELIQQVKDKQVVTKGNNRPRAWGAFYKNIAGHLTKGQKLIITPEWSRRPIHILDLAVKSAKQGRALRTKYS
jgi:hypothetical protein